MLDFGNSMWCFEIVHYLVSLFVFVFNDSCLHHIQGETIYTEESDLE